MAARVLTPAGSRKLVITSLGAPADHALQRPFVTLLPAFNPPERQQAEAITKDLIELGCVELCCVGPEAEQLHDALDSIIEANDALDVVTTWHEEPTEACEYFLYAAAGGRAHLLALVLSHPELQSMLDFAQELTMERDTLAWLQEWYRSRCDGKWEHQNGIRIETLDNPGWSVVADLDGADAPASVSEERSDDDWVRCDAKDGRFHGHGGPGNLQEILEILRTWIRTSHG
ncbi:immunity 53 family protein [Sorangium sp. So ce1667]